MEGNNSNNDKVAWKSQPRNEEEKPDNKPSDAEQGSHSASESLSSPSCDKRNARPRMSTRKKLACCLSITAVIVVIFVILYRQYWKPDDKERPIRLPQNRLRVFIAVNGPLVDTRLDPIVNPGTCSGHVHSVFGSAEFASLLATAEDLAVDADDWRNDTIAKEQATTSNVIPNKSIYWYVRIYNLCITFYLPLYR